jgi:calcineurin-like phosphoesterase family protein
MILRHRLSFVAAAAAVLTLGALPTVRSQPAQSRIVAIADIHGAADEFTRILQAAGVIDNERRWSGGTTRLVQTGDYFDRGAGIREVLDLLMRMDEQAPKAGGRAEILLGNHEVMNILREFRDVSPDAFASFADDGSEGRRQKAFEAHASIVKRRGGTLDREAWMRSHPPGYVEYAESLRPSAKYGRWLRSRKVVVRLDDTIFMHAGIAPALKGSLDDINRTVQGEIRAWDEAVGEMERAGIIAPSFSLRETVVAAVSELQRLGMAQQSQEPLPLYVTQDYIARLQRLTTLDTWAVVAPEGPLWFRGYATWGREAQTQLAALLDRFRAARFVVGHTPQIPGNIASRMERRIFLIDTGMLSTYYKGGRASALELQDGRITAIYTDRREPLQ